MLPGLLVPWWPNCPHGTFSPKNRVRKPPRSPAKRLVTRKVPMARAYRPCLWPRRSAFSPLCPHRGSGTFAGYQSRSRGPRARSHGGTLLRGQLAALPRIRCCGQAPGPRQQRTEQKRCDRPLPCFCHARAPFALVLQPYAPSVSDMPCADGYVSHKKAGARLKGSARRKGICFICRCNARGGRHAPRPDDPVRNDLRRSHGRDGRSVRWGRRSARP